MAPQIRVRVSVAEGDTRQFDNWGPKTISFRETDMIERAYGKSFGKFSDDLDSGSMYARRVLAWSLLKRENHAIKVDDLLDLKIGDVETFVVCSECDSALSMKSGQLVHDNGRESCGDEPEDPTAAEGQVPSATPDENESQNGETATSETSPTSSESDPGSGAD